MDQGFGLGFGEKIKWEQYGIKPHVAVVSESLWTLPGSPFREELVQVPLKSLRLGGHYPRYATRGWCFLSQERRLVVIEEAGRMSEMLGAFQRWSSWQASSLRRLILWRGGGLAGFSASLFHNFSGAIQVSCWGGIIWFWEIFNHL